VSSRGHNRERAVKRLLEGQDWVVIRAAGSLGPIDLVALKVGRTPRCIEVKSTARGPYEHFSPAERAEMMLVASMAGAVAELAWWPPRGQLRFITSDEWPVGRVAA
jgi:Holliday junction resolvase